MGCSTVSHPQPAGGGYPTQATVTTSAPLRSASLVVSDFVNRPARRQLRHIWLPDTPDPSVQVSLVRALEQLTRLRQLERGWDGLRAEPLTDDACATAIRLLTALALPVPPSAQLVPLKDGGLQIEFHVEGNDVELEIDADGEVHAYIVVDGDEVVMNREVPAPLLPTTMPVIKRHITRMSRILGEQS